MNDELIFVNGRNGAVYPEKLAAQLRRDEGLRLFEYLDTKGLRTIGYGHRLFNEVITGPCFVDQAENWLHVDIAHAVIQVNEHLPWALKLGERRLGVLQNMCFNMGIFKLLKFHKMLARLQEAVETDIAADAEAHFRGAAREMVASEWHMQTRDRAKRLETQMMLNEWQ